MEYSTFGRHVAVDTWGVDFELLNNAEWLQAQMVEAAEVCGATVLSVQSKQFEPQGATVLLYCPRVISPFTLILREVLPRLTVIHAVRQWTLN